MQYRCKAWNNIRDISNVKIASTTPRLKYCTKDKIEIKVNIKFTERKYSIHCFLCNLKKPNLYASDILSAVLNTNNIVSNIKEAIMQKRYIFTNATNNRDKIHRSNSEPAFPM